MPITHSAIAVTVGGVSMLPALRRRSLSWERPINGRSRASLVLMSIDGSMSAPAYRAEVTISVDGVRVFGGVVLEIERRLLAGKRGVAWALECGGWETYADGVLLNTVIPAGTLKSQFTAAAANLAPVGITVDPAMPAGPSGPAVVAAFQHVSPTWDAIATQAGASWRISPMKLARADVPGAIAAPFSLGVGGEPVRVAGASHRVHGADAITRLWVRFGSSGTRDVVENRAGNGTRTYALEYAVASAPVAVIVNGVSQTVGAGQPWTYAAGVLTQDSGQPLLTGSDSVVVPYVAAFPSICLALDLGIEALYGEIAAVEDLPDVYDAAAAKAYAAGRLAIRKAIPRVAALTIWRPGLEPGMSVTVNLPALGMSGSWLVARVSPSHLLRTRRSPTRHVFAYALELVEGNALVDGWERWFRDLPTGQTGSAGVASVASSTPPSTSTPSAALTRGTFPLGGSLFAGVRSASYARVSAFGAVVDWPALPTGATVTARIARRTGAAGTTATARIWNLEDGAPVATGTGSTTTAAAGDVEVLSIPRAAAARTYFLEVTGSNANAPVMAEGVLDVVVG